MSDAANNADKNESDVVKTPRAPATPRKQGNGCPAAQVQQEVHEDDAPQRTPSKAAEYFAFADTDPFTFDDEDTQQFCEELPLPQSRCCNKLVRRLCFMCAFVASIGGAWFISRKLHIDELKKLESKVKSLEEIQLRLPAKHGPGSNVTEQVAGHAASKVPSSSKTCAGTDAMECKAGMPSAAETLTKSHAAAARDFPELSCKDTPHQEWRDVKELVGQQLGNWAAGVVRQDSMQLQNLVDIGVHRIEGVPSDQDKCWMGRIFFTLLSLLDGVASGSIKEVSLKGMVTLHTPLLTLLLTMPWGVILRSGWPLFSLLSQLQMRTQKNFDLPLSGPLAAYFDALREALLHQNHVDLGLLGAGFLRAMEKEGKQEQQHIMAILCALATQLFNPEALDPADPDKSLQFVQGFFRQAVSTVDDLESTILSAWPLYGLLHAASVRLQMPAAGAEGS